MKRPQKVSQHPPAESQRRVEVAWTKLFSDTWAIHKSNPRALDGMRRFLLLKKVTPNAPFGSKDRFFAAGPMAGLLHAGLTHDISIVYTIGGRDPTVIKLYAVATHDELGTGHTSGSKRMQQTMKRITNTVIDPSYKPNELPEGLTHS